VVETALGSSTASSHACAWCGRAGAARGAFWLRKGKVHPAKDLDVPELAFSSDRELKIRM